MFRALSLSFLGCLLLQCSPVYVPYSKQVAERDLSDYKTFKFSEMQVENESSWQPQAQNLEQVQQMIATELERRGISQVESDPDLLVNLGVVFSDEVQTRETDIRDAPMYMGSRNYHWESQEVVVREYQEGTLMMDVVDADNEEMIWQGAVKSTMTSNREKMQKRVEAGIDQLFKSFPE
jgi:hypothetical protein